MGIVSSLGPSFCSCRSALLDLDRTGLTLTAADVEATLLLLLDDLVGICFCGLAPFKALKAAVAYDVLCVVCLGLVDMGLAGARADC